MLDAKTVWLRPADSRGRLPLHEPC